MISIARAVLIEAPIIIDETTAPLTDHETGLLFDTLRRAKTPGIGIVCSSHQLEDVFEIANSAMVLGDRNRVGVLPVQGSLRLTRMLAS